MRRTIESLDNSLSHAWCSSLSASTSSVDFYTLNQRKFLYFHQHASSTMIKWVFHLIGKIYTLRDIKFKNYQLWTTQLVHSQSSQYTLFFGLNFVIFQMKIRIEPERAKAIGRMLFQKYDLGKRGALGPKQCYELFSDFCYRILAINPQPTMEQANSMYQVLDENKDKKVTESDFENLAVKYLCQSNSNMSGYSFNSSSNSGIQTSQVSQTYSSTSQVNINQSNFLQKSNVTRYVDTRTQQKSTKNLTVIAKKRIDVARRLFKMFDKDESGYLTEDQIPFIIEETYKELGQNYKPSREDVKSYMKMVDTDGDGKISLAEFEEIILRSLKNAGFEIYQ